MKKIILLLLSISMLANNLTTIKPCPQKENSTCLSFLVLMRLCQLYNTTDAGFKKCSDKFKHEALTRAPILKKYIVKRILMETELRTNDKSYNVQLLETMQACINNYNSSDPREGARCVMSKLSTKMPLSNLKVIASQEARVYEAAKRMQTNSKESDMRETFCQD